MSIGLRLFLFYLNHIAKPFNPSIPAPKFRELMKAADNKLELLPEKVATIDNRTITARDGYDIPIRIYKPSDKQNLPIIVFFHGGGFVIRGLESHDRACRRIANRCEAIVVAVDYRLAPEHKFPTPVQDAYDATVWVAKNAEMLGGNTDKLITMGDSAGGNLATVMALLAKENGFPKIAKQVMIYPTTDSSQDYPSRTKYGDKYMLTHGLMMWFGRQYAAKREDIFNPLMSPILAKDLSELPPAFVITASLDPLQDEGEAYAKKLQAAGNTVKYKQYKNAIHDILILPKVMKKQHQEMMRDIVDFVKE